MEISTAVLMAGLISLVGITLLALFNPATALLGTVALVSYAFMYTPMKRESPAAVTVGAVAGALPTLIGCVAAEGRVSMLGVTLFAIQFLWQYTHFWSIAWLGFSDYQKAGYKFLPQKDGAISSSVGTQAFVFALLLIPVAFVPFWIGSTGMISAILVAVISIMFTYFAWQFYKRFDRQSALRLMFSSFLYIPLVLIIYLIDKI
jgi:protoheme IX farnesyltransferase